MNGVMVHELHVLLKGVMHEGQSVWTVAFRRIDVVAFLLEPLDLVSPDAVHAAPAPIAVGATSTEEPEPGIADARISIALDRYLVSELIGRLLVSIVLEIVWQRGGVLVGTIDLHHGINVHIGLEIVETWHDSIRHLLCSQNVGQILVVGFPEVFGFLVPGLTTDDISSDGNEVWLLLVYQVLNHLQRLVVQVRARFTEMEVSELHDLEMVVIVHFQVYSAHPIEVMFGKG